MTVPGWLERVSLDWTDFDKASRISSDIVRELASDRPLLRRLVLSVQRDERLRFLAEKHDELNYIVLYDALDRGLRVRLHRFSQGLEDIPHNHRFSFSSALLSGSYVHTLFQVERREDEDDREPWRLHQPTGSHVGVDVRELPVAGQAWPWGDPHRYPHSPHPLSGGAERAWEGARAAGIAQGEPVAIDADPNADSTAVSPPKYR